MIRDALTTLLMLAIVIVVLAFVIPKLLPDLDIDWSKFFDGFGAWFTDATGGLFGSGGGDTSYVPNPGEACKPGWARGIKYDGEKVTEWCVPEGYT